MGKDVEQIQKLLAEGYQITSKNYSLKRNEDDSNSMTITVILKKGSDEKNIISIEDDEIFGFLQHFVFMLDQYDNSVAVYVDDPSAYEPNDPEKLPMLPRDKHIITIGHRRFEEGVSLQYFEPNPKNKIDTAAGFWIYQNKNPEVLDVDYKDQVRIFEKDSKKLIFDGLIKSATNDKGIISFRCHSGTKQAHYQKLGLETHIENLLEQMYFITKAAGGMNLKINPEIIKKINLNERDFVIIMPLQNLFLRERIKIGDVEIYTDFVNNEDYLIRQSGMAQKDSDWDGNKLRISTVVKSTNFFDAVMLGYKKISNVIDWLALRSDFSFPKYDVGSKQNPVYFSMYRHMARIKTPPKVFCKEKDTANFLIYDLESNLDNQIVLDYEANSFFEVTKELIEPLLSKHFESLTNIERSILNSIHWLRLGLFTERLTERLIFLYNALEFAIAEIPTKKIFSKEEIKSIRKKIISEKLGDSKKKKLEFALSQLNNLSLNEILMDFCTREKIPLSEEEWKIIKTCREKRNDVIHGKSDVVIKYTETDKLQTLIERILLKRLDN